MSGEIACESCGKNFTAKKNLYAHLRKVHNIFPEIRKAEVKIWCADCGKGFSFKSNLYVHMKKFHMKEVNKPDVSQIIIGFEADRVIEDVSAKTRMICSVCNKTFATSSNLNRHLRSSHKEEYRADVLGQVICWFCKRNIMGGHLFHKHLKDDHGMEIDVEFHSFKTMMDFEVWRRNTEEKSLSLYVKIKGDDTRNPNKVISTYYCNRSGKARVKKLGEKKRKKSRPTAKINSSCPSQIVLVRSNDVLRVKYVKTHIGHGVDEHFLKSKKRDQRSLSERVCEEVTNPTEEDMNSEDDSTSLGLVHMEDETMFLEELDQRLSVQALTQVTNYTRDCSDVCKESASKVDMDPIFSSELMKNPSSGIMLSDLSLHPLENGWEIVAPIQEVTIVTSL